GSAVFLSAAIKGVGSVDNTISNNIIHDHPQVGIDINSTTYFEFAGPLGACDRNVLSGNEIYNVGSSIGGDAGSAIVIVGNSSSNHINSNTIHNNGTTAGGFGIVISGSVQGNGTPGTPKFDETPNNNEISGNSVYNNKEEGIRIKGATNTLIKSNNAHDNGQKAAS